MPSYQLAGVQHNPHRTVINIGSTTVGGGGMLIIAGPCAVENREMMLQLAPVSCHRQKGIGGTGGNGGSRCRGGRLNY